jgi:hypothetical protein
MSLAYSGAARPVRVALYRSYVDLERLDTLDLYAYPITKTVHELREGDCVIVDSMPAHNCPYSYYAKLTLSDGREVPSTVCHVAVPDVMLPCDLEARADVLIDKVHYFLEVSFDGVPVKRYPVSLGGDPRTRKLHQDRRSTPEGRYKITYVKQQSQFYKAIGVNYPNALDRQRYADALRDGRLPFMDGRTPSIGGEIQIHGGGIGNNWTWGCIAMRNEDIDEILACHAVRVGTQVDMVGEEVTRAELKGRGRASDVSR